MASSAALRRLRKEYGTLKDDPPPGAIVEPLETNFLHAHFLLHGSVFYDTPYEGGVYHGVLKFPSNYPLAPPTVIMRTPSGRFQTDTRICFSLSDFHPELWNPLWSIRTIITGLISFMNSDEITTGGLEAPDSYRVDMAKKSLSHCLANNAKSLFGVFLEGIERDRRGTGKNKWPPSRPAEIEVKAPLTSSSPVAVPKLAKSQTPRCGVRESPLPPAQQVDGPDSVVAAATAAATTPPSSSHSSTVSLGTSCGKNAAKNKKKKEREKRKTKARRFLDNLRDCVPDFIRDVVSILATDKYGLDLSPFPADHVCWRTETIEEYEELCAGLCSLGTDYCVLLVESEVAGRVISTFRLSSAIEYENGRSIDIVEIPSPKDGSAYRSGLEHVEFILHKRDTESILSPVNDDRHQEAFESLMREYPGVDWNDKARGKVINPDISLQLELQTFGRCSIKFHLVPLAKIIEFEQARLTDSNF